MSLFNPTQLAALFGDYRVGGAGALSDGRWLVRAQTARAAISKLLYANVPESLTVRAAPKAQYEVTRKFDGEFNLIVVQGDEVCSITPGGTVRTGYPALIELAERIRALGATRAVLLAELYAADPQRERVAAVIGASRRPASSAEVERLRLAVFDVLDWDGKAIEKLSEARVQLDRLGEGERFLGITALKAESHLEILAIYRDLVERHGAEGIVYRSEDGPSGKLKPVATLDVAVLGFTESAEPERAGLLHDLIVGLIRHDGHPQVLTHVGGGFSDADRASLLTQLRQRVVPSDWAETNDDQVAYEMIAPGLVAEIAVTDLISETSRGQPVLRMVLEYSSGSYRPLRRMPLVTAVFPRFLRLRHDKAATHGDSGTAQLERLIPIDGLGDAANAERLPESELLERIVFAKLDKEMEIVGVRKIVAWKTNKESSGQFPAFAVLGVDYSDGRAEPLKRDLYPAVNLEGVNEIVARLRGEYQKKGWTER